MKYGDVMPYSPAVENDKMFCKISAELAKAIADGKVTISAAMDMYQRGGDPEKLLADVAPETPATDEPEKKRPGRPRVAAAKEKESDPFKANGGDLPLNS